MTTGCALNLALLPDHVTCPSAYTGFCGNLHFFIYSFLFLSVYFVLPPQAKTILKDHLEFEIGMVFSNVYVLGVRQTRFDFAFDQVYGLG